jgi:hypothetical protein
VYHPQTDASELLSFGESLTTQNDDPRKPDRRRVPRYPFIASAEFSQTNSGPRIEARVNELGMFGCYLETSSPAPEGALIFVKIFREADFFESSATVAYSHPNRGMGIKFRDYNRLHVGTLQKWLLEAMNATRA